MTAFFLDPIKVDFCCLPPHYLQSCSTLNRMPGDGNFCGVCVEGGKWENNTRKRLRNRVGFTSKKTEFLDIILSIFVRSFSTAMCVSKVGVGDCLKTIRFSMNLVSIETLLQNKIYHLSINHIIMIYYIIII